MTAASLPPLEELAPAPRRKGFRGARPGWPGPADAATPVFPVDADALWRAWMDFAVGQPRTVRRAQDERTRRMHVQRSRFLRFPDLVRAEILPLGPARSGLLLDSRARFGRWDLGVNRRRGQRWSPASSRSRRQAAPNCRATSDSHEGQPLPPHAT